MNNLASLYQAEGRTADALPLVERMMAGGRAQLRVALPVLLDAQRQHDAAEKAFDEALDVIQRGAQSSAASAVNKLAVRLAAGSDHLAELVRRDQDLASEADRLDKAIIARCLKQGSTRDAAAEQAAIVSPPLPPNAPGCKRPCRRNFPIMRRCRIRCR